MSRNYLKTTADETAILQETTEHKSQTRENDFEFILINQRKNCERAYQPMKELLETHLANYCSTFQTGSLQAEATVP